MRKAYISGLLLLIAASVLCFLMAIGKNTLKVEPQIAVKSPSPIESNAGSNFDRALQVVYVHEGYISDDSDDKGGYTKWGISLSFLKAEQLDIDGDGDVDMDDVRALSKDKTRKLYYDLFWKRNNYDDIKDLKVATKIFDMAVNVGGSRANKIVKKAINYITDEDIYVTGILDVDTMDLINEIEPVVLLDAIRKEQADFYRALVKKNPLYKKFEKGWLNRSRY